MIFQNHMPAAKFCDIVFNKEVLKMKENEFRCFLENVEQITSKEKAIKSRISRAYLVEEILCEDLDCIVNDDKKMYDALIVLKELPDEHNGNLQNALRWYYKFANNKEFPRMHSYSRK